MVNEVHLLPFRFKYLQDLIDMHAARDNALNCELTMQDLPKIGYIAYLGRQAVAAGFLRRVEPNYAQLDTFLSSPHFGSIVRHKALLLIVDTLIQDAKDLNLRGIIAFTKDESILRRANAAGFHIIDNVVIGKALT